MAILLTNCEGCGDCQEYHVPNEYNQYFTGFRPGSYWIYRNVANGDIDSVYVIKRELTYTGKQDCLSEEANIYFGGFSMAPYIHGLTSGQRWVMHAQNPFDGKILHYLFDIRSKLELSKTTSSVIGQTAFNNVLFIQHCCEAECGQYDWCSQEKYTRRFTRLDFSKNIGLIRWQAVNHPQFGAVTYELVRYRTVF